MSKFNYEKVKQATTLLLEAIGEDVDREGLADTPRRVADFWKEFILYEPGNHDTHFESLTVDQMVVVSGMRVWSLCEHHLLPFYCDVTVGYLTKEHVLGLSKFGRILQKHAHKLQIQERLVSEMAQDVISIVGTEDVAVIAQGEHLCMTMRGIKLPATMTSSSLNGVFKKEGMVRSEFLSLALAANSRK